MKKIKFILLFAVTALAAVSCSKNEDTKGGSPVLYEKIAVLLPDGEANARWTSDKANMEKAFKQINASDVTYYTAAESDEGASKQADQIKEAYNNGVRNFIITAINYNVLNEAMKGMTDVRVVCHDRLMRDNAAIGAYSSCDARQVGQLQAQYLVMAFTASGKKTMNLEMLAGPKSDENSEDFFEGAYEVLKTYINNGSFNVVSGKKTFSDVALSAWTADAAKTEMTERLKKYTVSKVDMVLAPNDGTAAGVIAAFDEAKYSINDFPYITGQDNTESAQQYIKDGKQFMTVDKSLTDMAFNSVSALANLMNGGVPTSDSWVDNGSKRVPFVKSAPVAIIDEDSEGYDYYRVAVLLPTWVQTDLASNPRWEQDSILLSQAMAQYGVNVDFYRFSDNDEGAEKQVATVEECLSKGIKNFLIAPIDGYGFKGVFDNQTGLNIVCHDRMIYNIPQVGCYSACDPTEIGRLQASSLINAAAKKQSGQKIYLEMFAGPESDINAKYFYEGAYALLKEYIDKGQFEVKSNKVAFKDVALSAWSKDSAKVEMKERLIKYYTGQTDLIPNLILAPNDGTAAGIIEALDEAGYKVGTGYPFITGQDYTAEGRQNIIDGKQGMTIDKNLLDMTCNSTLVLINMMNGVMPVTSKYFINGSTSVPFLVTTPEVITKDDLTPAL